MEHMTTSDLGIPPILDPATLDAEQPDRRGVLLAAPRGYCAGVDRAVITVEKALDLYGAPVYVRKQIVHNKHVVQNLESRGAIFVEELAEPHHPDVARVQREGAPVGVVGRLAVHHHRCALDHRGVQRVEDLS